MDEKEEELRQQWADHRRRFKSGAKRSSLRGVIKSSYLTELSGNGGRDPRTAGGGAVKAAAAAAAATTEGGGRPAGSHGGSYLSRSPYAVPPRQQQGPPSLASRQGGGGSDDDDDDSSWEDLRASSSSEDSATAASAVLAAAASSERARLPPPRETVHVLTTPGPTRVTIVGDRGTRGGAGGGTKNRMPVLTLHAVGHNHRTCLGALEREVAKDEDLSGVVFYHVDTPGHQEEAEGVE